MIDPVEICRERGWPLVTASDQGTLDGPLQESLKQSDDTVVWLKDLSGPVSFNFPSGICHCGVGVGDHSLHDGHSPVDMPCTDLDCVRWLIVSGGSEPIHPDWVRSLRDQFQAAGVPFYFLGWGDFAGIIDDDEDETIVNEFLETMDRTLDGRTWEEMP